MKNLTLKLQSLKDAKIVIKRDFLIKLIIYNLDNLSEKDYFIDNYSTPMKLHQVNEEMNKLIDGLFGYYIYLYNKEPNKYLFTSAAYHDLGGFIKGGEDTGFLPRTINYSCYLKQY